MSQTLSVNTKSEEVVDVTEELHVIFATVFKDQKSNPEGYFSQLLEKSDSITFTDIINAPEVQKISTNADVIRSAIRAFKGFYIQNETVRQRRTYNASADSNVLMLRELNFQTSEEVMILFKDIVCFDGTPCPSPISARLEPSNTWCVVFKSEDDAKIAIRACKVIQYEGRPLRARLKNDNYRPYYERNQNGGRRDMNSMQNSPAYMYSPASPNMYFPQYVPPPPGYPSPFYPMMYSPMEMPMSPFMYGYVDPAYAYMQQQTQGGYNNRNNNYSNGRNNNRTPNNQYNNNYSNSNNNSGNNSNSGNNQNNYYKNNNNNNGSNTPNSNYQRGSYGGGYGGRGGGDRPNRNYQSYGNGTNNGATSGTDAAVVNTTSSTMSTSSEVKAEEESNDKTTVADSYTMSLEDVNAALDDVHVTISTTTIGDNVRLDEPSPPVRNQSTQSSEKKSEESNNNRRDSNRTNNGSARRRDDNNGNRRTTSVATQHTNTSSSTQILTATTSTVVTNLASNNNTSVESNNRNNATRGNSNNNQAQTTDTNSNSKRPNKERRNGGDNNEVKKERPARTPTVKLTLDADFPILIDHKSVPAATSHSFDYARAVKNAHESDATTKTPSPPPVAVASATIVVPPNSSSNERHESQSKPSTKSNATADSVPTAVPIVKAAEQPSANLTFGVFTVANSDSSVSDQPSPNSTSSKALEEKLIPLQFGDFVLSTTSHYGDAHEVKHEVPVKKEASVETPPTNGKKSFIEVLRQQTR